MKQFYNSVLQKVQKNYRLYRILICFALLATLHSVAVAQRDGIIPITAKVAYRSALKKLDSMQIKDAKLVYVDTDVSTGNRSVVQSLGYVDSLFSEVYEWNGKAHWIFYFITDSVPVDFVLTIYSYLDSATQEYFNDVHNSRRNTIPIEFDSKHDITITDTTWLDSDSIAKLPRLQATQLWWKIFSYRQNGAGDNVKIRLKTMFVFDVDSGKSMAKSQWLFSIRSYNFFFDAETGKEEGVAVTSVEEQRDVSGRGGIVPNPARESIAIPEIQQGSVEIHSMFGSIAVPAREYDGSSIDVSMLPTGTYYVRCTTAQGVIVKPFVIVR